MLRLFLRIGDQFYTFSFDQTTENVLYIPDFIDSIRQHKYLPFPQAKSRATLFVEWKKNHSNTAHKKAGSGFHFIFIPLRHSKLQFTLGNHAPNLENHLTR